MSPGRPSSWLRPGDPLCQGCGGTGGNRAGNDACPACRGFGSAPPPLDSPCAPEGAICAACGRPGGGSDPVLAAAGSPVHRSHAAEQQKLYQAALARLAREGVR
jgi:hypothetical protein